MSYKYIVTFEVCAVFLVVHTPRRLPAAFVILTNSNHCVYHLYLTLVLIYLRGLSMGSHFRHAQMFTHEYSEGEIRQLVVYDQYPMYSI